MLNEVDLYIKQFPDNVQLQLTNLRKIIIQAAPNAAEIISYKMPAYKLHECLVYFAGYKTILVFILQARELRLLKMNF